VAAVGLFAACDAWKDDIAVKNDGITRNLYETLSAQADLSTFAEILKQTGYDVFLQEEPALTVFAPKNSALSGFDASDTEKMKEWVKNYIAYLAYYTDNSGNFEVAYIRMLNDKYLPVGASGISGTHISTADIVASNGVLHIVDDYIVERKSVWDYLNSLSGYPQIDCIRSFDETVMDSVRSVQTGININGKPVYDTVWTVRNTFLEAYDLADETKAFTVVLLENESLDRLKSKYSKYIVRKDPALQAETVIREITLDLLLYPQTIESTGRYPSYNNVLVDVNPADIVETYQASNGMVYKLRDADVKMYNNKISEQIIEAENFVERWDGQNGWSTRYRTWASGGQDIILKGQTQNTFEYDLYDADADSMVHHSDTKTFQMHYRTASESYISKSNNAYSKYEPVMYAVPYEIHWMAYDDNSNHFYTVNDTISFSMTLEQKMLLSFPDEPVVTRLSDGKISNNFSSYSMMAGVSTAGVQAESLLTRYRTSTSNEGLYLLDQPFPSEDDYGLGSTLKCPYYGKATLMVANTVRKTDTYAGVLFLDYIRLTPFVDPND
jgi:hypothetical protein